MDKKEYEKEVTKSIADTFGFLVREKDLKCVFCGKRFMNYGMQLNERMIEHSKREHPLRYGADK
jgi:hypothetical protein